MILYRPVGLQELELIYDSGMKVFPARLPQQPIFYPVLQLEYARQIASDWNVKREQSAGYVTQFKVEDEYVNRFETHTVGSSQYQELWIPAEEIEEFNKHILGHIKVLEAHFGDTFQGFVPDKFGLQGKSAVEQFTLLANSFIYKRMDFYLEIKRNHKAVFLNYPFWQKHEFKNPGLKEKIIKAIMEAWSTSFPKIPLPVPPPVDEEAPPVKQANAPTHAHDSIHAIEKDTPKEKQIDTRAIGHPFSKDIKPANHSDSHAKHLVKPVDEDAPLIKQSDSQAFEEPLDEEFTLEEETASPSLENSLDENDEDAEFEEQIDSPSAVNHVHENLMLPKPTDSHFMQGVKLGLGGNDHEAVAELSRAIEEDSEDVVAQVSLGVAFHRLGEDDRALSCYEAALKLDPRHAEAHYFRANLLYRQGNVREAMAEYTLAVGLEPILIKAHEETLPEDRLTDYSPAPAEIFRIAKPAHRILDLNQTLEANPTQASAFKERAAEYSRLRNYEQAIADYTSSLALQPDDADALHARGVAYEQWGQHERARKDYQRALAVDPQLANEYINRGVTFAQMGNLRQSIASFSDGIRLAPQNPDAYFNRGTAYFQLGEFESAMQDFSDVIRLSPGDEAAYYWRGISHEQAGRQREAIADYRQFLALSQDENARAEIEQRLSQWNEPDRNSVREQTVIPHDMQETGQAPAEEQAQQLDLYELITALGERALNSTWFGSGLDCDGENAQELYALTDQNRPIQGHDFLRLAAGIRRTTRGDFQAFDPGAIGHWIFLHAWDGNGFYMETDDPQIKKQLKSHFQAVEELEGADPPYVGLFIRI